MILSATSANPELLRAIADGVPDGIYVKDRAGRFLFINAGAAKAAGVPAEEMIGRLDSEFFDEKTVMDFRRNERVVLRGETINEQETTFADDREYVFNTVKVPLRDAAGDIIGVIGVSRDITAQVQVETALREVEERFRLAHEFAAFGSSINGLDGRWLHVNQSLCNILGYTEKDLLARTFQDVTYPDDLPEDELMVAALIEGSEKYLRRDKRYIHKDGHIVWCELTVSLVQDRAGRPLYFVAQIQDISERIATQTALRESEAQLRFLFESMTEGVLYRSRSGEITHANPAAQRMLGLKARGALFVPGLRVLGQDGGELASGALPTMRALRTGEILRDIVLGIEGDDMQVRWVSATAIPQFQPGETTPYRVYCTFKDITESLVTERELRRSRERLQIVLQQAPAVLWTTNRDLDITWCDGAAFSKLEWTAEHATGLNLTTWFGEDAEAVRVHRAALKGASGRYELTLNGSVFDVYADPLRDADRNVIGVLCLALDTTDAKNAEVTMKHQEDQLRQAQKMEAIGRLAGGVAHDFNNLLTAITGHAEFAMEALDPRDPVVDDIHEIQRSADRAAALTRQLLAFSRRQVLQASVIDLNVVAHDQRSLLKRLIGEDIELRHSAAEEDCCVFADRSQIEQVVMNLSVNARDAMPEGGVLTIDSAPVVFAAPVEVTSGTMPAGEYARLTVADTGSGIPEEYIKQIFEPFFTTKPVGRGTGLGLSTVYGIIQQSGGYIDVRTETGKGTRFDIYLTRVFAEPDDQIIVRAGAAANPGETVLVVEDEAAVRVMTERILKSRGYTVLSARNGSEALMVAETYHGKIHLLLSDVIMPSCGGRELATKISAARSGTRVLFMSGYTDEAIEHHGVLAPGTWFLQKPFTPDALAKRVRQVLDSVAAPHHQPAAE